ncbi:MAG: heparinase II/III family protein [Phycisphaeraceae bacterium]
MSEQTCRQLSPGVGLAQAGVQVRPGHPRVLVRPEDLEPLRQRAATTHATEMRALLAVPDTQTEGKPGDDQAALIWRLAFRYLITQETDHARAVIVPLRRLLELEVSGEYFVGARRLKALAACYDWLHDVLDSAGEEGLRLRVGRRALAYCQALYDSGEVEPGCYFLGHAINQMPAILMAAIAIGDEIDGARWFLDDTLARWDQQVKGYRHFLEQDCFQMSYSYTCTYTSEFPYIFQAIEAGLGIAMFSANPWLANLVKWWTYAMRDDETFIRFGDYFCSFPVLENQAYHRPLAAIASHYKDPLAQWWANRFQLKGAEPEQMLFEDRPGVAPRSPDELQLPRTKLFAPMGIAIARGDFAASGGRGRDGGGTVAAFKCTPVYLHNHGHRDANSFTIYHKGDLAIDSGAYDGYETPQWYNYYIRTIAHNTIVIHDPTEQFISRGKEYVNDGGQRFVNDPHFQPTKFEDMQKEAFRAGRIAAYQEGKGWSYVCGDASNCYGKEKLTRFLRHVVFILDWPSKAAVSMVVLDELEMARDGLEPRFLLHTMDEPQVDGNRIVARHGQGRLTATVLHPQAAVIQTIGGAGREFEVDGRNFPLNRQLAGPHTAGAWRVEVTGATAAPCDGGAGTRRFLTMLTPADAQAPAEPPVTVERTSDTWIIRQGGLAVTLFQGGQAPQLDGGRVIAVRLAESAK